MTDLYRELVERIRGEVPDLDQTVQRVLTAWEKAQEIAEEKKIMKEYGSVETGAVLGDILGDAIKAKTDKKKEKEKK